MVDHRGVVDVNDDGVGHAQRSTRDVGHELLEPDHARVGEARERHAEHLTHRPGRQAKELQQDHVVAEPIEVSEPFGALLFGVQRTNSAFGDRSSEPLAERFTPAAAHSSG